MKAMDVALICKALGDANRLEIVQMLSAAQKIVLSKAEKEYVKNVRIPMKRAKNMTI